jgi:DNA-binding PadR family transcriptional regulator
MSDLSYVNELTPEEAMNYLRTLFNYVWWEDIRAKVWEDKLPGPSWVWAYEAIERLERGPEPETLMELGEITGINRSEIYLIWSKLSERQREKVIRDITRDLASKGLEKFLEATVKALSVFDITEEGRRSLEHILNKAVQFVKGKINFDELMNSVAELLSQRMRGRDSEIFMKGVALGKYLTRTELKKLVEKPFIRVLDKILYADEY